MHRTHRLALAALASALAGALVAAPAGAQGIYVPAVRLGPQFVSYDIKDPVDKTISQFALPFGVGFPFGTRFSVDIATAYASSQVKVAGKTSEITGLTDTQLRANYVFGADNVVITAGLNLPTGNATVNFDTEFEAATQIGNDFLAFPVSNMGTGFGGTGGVAVARNFGAWNLGGGVAFRYAGSYDAFELEDEVTRFTPSNEIRLRVGGDRSAGAGRLMVGLTYSAFGEDDAGGTTYSTGDRFIAQGGWSTPIGGATLALSAWDLYRMKGEIVGGEAPSENIANLAAAVGFAAGGLTIEPNVEARMATSDDVNRRGNLAQLGLRLRGTMGRLEISPSAAYSMGSVGGDASKADMTGVRGILSIRLMR
jgi:hypothetical protein